MVQRKFGQGHERSTSDDASKEEDDDSLELYFHELWERTRGGGAATLSQCGKNEKFPLKLKIFRENVIQYTNCAVCVWFSWECVDCTEFLKDNRGSKFLTFPHCVLTMSSRSGYSVDCLIRKPKLYKVCGPHCRFLFHLTVK